ncbi:AI-2E family transporter [Cohnella xylanilytica]|uniref:AI-2E family transporter n=1 Tax=Cohnella xylanilytica TaxID=557555 RepID=A0A841TNM4_9BACL|nr:AI-2E family transporter [Cohnella xylanilytica]MBB6689857.1 AI-2E family transporter [Cohnella xylanilytica]
MIVIPQGKYFRIGYGIIVVLLIALLASKVDFLFRPFGTVLKALLLPLLLSAIFYYLLRPPVNYLTKQLKSRTLAISAVFLGLAGIFVLIGILVGPIIRNQVDSLVNNLPQLVKLGEDQVAKLQRNEWAARYLLEHQIDLSAKIPDMINRIVSRIGDAFNGIVGFVSNVVLLLSTVPFIVFYMLKGGNKFPELILRFVPDKHDEEARQIMKEMDATLSAYIQGKILVSLCFLLLTLVGYWIIGLQYSLLLAIALTLMNFIPYVGILIGMVPSVIVAFLVSPWRVAETIIVVVLVQQLEDKLLSPLIMGKKLAIHPLTIIIVLLAVGSLSGLFGMFVAVPTYALVKVVATHLYRLYRLRKIEIIEAP